MTKVHDVERFRAHVAALQSALDGGDATGFCRAFDALGAEMDSGLLPELKRLTASAQSALARFSAEMARSFASSTDVARLARAAGVGRLVFSRVYPPLSSPIIRWAFLQKARAIFPDSTVGEDGMTFRLDAKP